MASKRSLRWLAWLAAVLMLGLVFLMYFRRDLVFDLGTRLWNCF